MTKNNSDSNSTPQNLSQITQSPYYKDGATSLPNGTHVEVGGFYGHDDAGGIVFQMFTESTIINGSIDLVEKVAAVDMSSGLVSQSYKELAALDKRATELVNGFTVTNLIPSGRQPLPVKVCRFQVADVAAGKFFYIYDVNDPNGQLSIFHDGQVLEEPGIVPKTETDLIGLVYVQFEGQVYVGSLTPAKVIIVDPSGDFREAIIGQDGDDS